jgi:hypothetical protein
MNIEGFGAIATSTSCPSTEFAGFVEFVKNCKNQHGHPYSLLSHPSTGDHEISEETEPAGRAHEPAKQANNPATRNIRAFSAIQTVSFYFTRPQDRSTFKRIFGYCIFL